MFVRVLTLVSCIAHIDATTPQRQQITGAQILSCFSAIPFSNIQKVISLLVLGRGCVAL